MGEAAGLRGEVYNDMVVENSGGVDRRKLLKVGVGAVAATAAVSALPALRAQAAAPRAAAVPAATPKKVAIGTIAVERLWGSYTKTTYEYYYVTDSRGRQVRKRRTIKTKVLGTRSAWSGTDTKTLNKGGVCHWIGTATPHSKGNCVWFGHRTSAGAPLRNVHKVLVGDLVVLTVAGSTKTYRVVELPPVIGSRDFASAINWGDKTKAHLTLVACTKTNRLPTSTKFRLLVRCVEV